MGCTFPSLLAAPAGAVLASPGAAIQPRERALSFAIELIVYVLGSIAVAVCLLAIPGAPGTVPPAAPDQGHGHGGH